MSSLARRTQIRMLKKIGFTRQTHSVRVIGDSKIVIKLPKGKGSIIDPLGEDTGSKHWPKTVALGKLGEDTPKEKVKNPPRGSRRRTMDQCIG